MRERKSVNAGTGNLCAQQLVDPKTGDPVDRNQAVPVFETTVEGCRFATQLVNESDGANLRATKILSDMLKDAEKEAGAAPPPESRDNLSASSARS